MLSRYPEIVANIRHGESGRAGNTAVGKWPESEFAKDSTIISIQYDAASPTLAHDVVDAVTKVFLEEHLRLNHSEGSFGFFSEQADSLHKQLVAAQTELRDRKNEFRVVSIESRRALFDQQLKNVELELLQSRRDVAASGAKIGELKTAIARLEPELVTNRVGGIANVAKDSMRDKLYDLEIQESKLRARFKDDHPLLLQIQKQREEAEDILAGLPNERTQTTNALNPNQRQLELELAESQANDVSLQARVRAAEAQQADVYKQLADLNDHELKITELERNAQLLDGKYRMHVEKLEQARVNDALGRERITNVNVAQPATTPEKPSHPDKAVLLIAGLIFATGGALALAFVAERFDQTLRTTRQIEAELGLPVLFSFPRRKRGRRRVKITASTLSNGTNGTAVNYVAPQRSRYRQLAKAILHANGKANGNGHGKVVGVVGCETSKFRSRVAAELAIHAASATDSVLLIDADARRRHVARRFGLNGSPGWREVLDGSADAKSCIQRSNRENLAVMSPGSSNGHQSEPKTPGDVLGQLSKIKNDYGLVVVDLPPARESVESSAAAAWLDEMVLVVEAERTRIQTAQHAKAIIERTGVRLAGVVLANRRDHVPSWLYRRL